MLYKEHDQNTVCCIIFPVCGICALYMEVVGKTMERRFFPKKYLCFPLSSLRTSFHYFKYNAQIIINACKV